MVIFGCADSARRHWTSVTWLWLARRIYMEARDRHGVRNISEAGTLDLFLSFPCA